MFMKLLSLLTYNSSRILHYFNWIYPCTLTIFTIFLNKWCVWAAELKDSGILSWVLLLLLLLSGNWHSRPKRKMVDAIVKDGCSLMGASPSRVWIDFHLLSYHWWFLFLRWHRRFLELNFYWDCKQLLPLHGVVHFLVLWHVSKHRQVSEGGKVGWKGDEKPKLGGPPHWGSCMPENSRLCHWLHVNSGGVKAPSRDGLPAPCLYRLWCEECIEALGKEWRDCELQRHSYLSLEVTTGIGRSVVHLAW